MTLSSKKLCEKINEILLDHKAENILTIDLKGKTSIADFFILASGTSTRHVSALADSVIEELAKLKIKPLSMEGKTTCEWVLLDFGNVILHLFKREIREVYNLEKMWSVPGKAD